MAMKHNLGDDPATVSSTGLERTLAQRNEALERAELVRGRRAQLKRDLKVGRASIVTLLQDPPDYIHTAKVFDMLLAVPSYGRVKVTKVLQSCRISPSQTIGGLSERQRYELVEHLRGGSGSPRGLPQLGHKRPRTTSRPQPPSAEPAPDELLTRDLEHLLEQAREVGQRAGQAAAAAGVTLDAPSRRQDLARLQAGVARKLRESVTLAPHVHVCVTVAGNEAQVTVTDAADSRAVLVASASEDERSIRELHRVNEVRLARAELKRRIAGGTITVAEVIVTCPPEAASMTVGELLTSQRRWGAARSSRFLAAVGMPETRTVGELSHRQRSVLTAALAI